MKNTIQNEISAPIGTKAVSSPLAPIVHPTTAFPPSHSASIPPGNDVNKYPQKYDPSKRLCCDGDQLYLGPYYKDRNTQLEFSIDEFVLIYFNSFK